MDQVIINVTDIRGVKLGDEAILFGSPTLTIDDAARADPIRQLSKKKRTAIQPSCRFSLQKFRL